MIRDHVSWLVLLRNNKWEITDSVLTSSLLLKDKSIFCLCVYPNKRCPHPTQVGFWGLWGPGSLATWLAPSSGGGKRHRCCLHPGGPFTLLILYSIFLLYSTLYTFLCSGGSPPEAQKPKTFRVATFYAQKLSGRSVRNSFSQQG